MTGCIDAFRQLHCIASEMSPVVLDVLHVLQACAGRRDGALRPRYDAVDGQGRRLASTVSMCSCRANRQPCPAYMAANRRLVGNHHYCPCAGWTNCLLPPACHSQSPRPGCSSSRNHQGTGKWHWTVTHQPHILSYSKPCWCEP
jgi:hypothetical protein